MLYLAVVWTAYVLIFLLWGIARVFKIKQINKFLEKYVLLVILVCFSFLIIAIVTNDPIAVGDLVIPTEIQWLASLITSFFVAWKFYLNPLKNKVYRMDREIGEVKVTVQRAESELTNYFNRLQENIERIEKAVYKKKA